MAYTTINKGSSYFNTVLYTGNGATQSITGVGFQPDWVWIKNRSNAVSHCITDAVRGTNLQLASNSTGGDQSTTDGITSFNSNGFSLGAGTQQYSSNTNAQTYASWNWLGANTTASNTSGTITSTVSANTTAGFSIVKWTGTGVTASVGHGLGVTPQIVIKKNLSTATNWIVSTTIIDGSNDFFYLNATNAKGDSSETAPTSTLINLFANSENNGSGNGMIAYCFANVKGYSKFGIYTGNGSSNGSFVYTGFRPAFVLIKSSSTVENWHIFDDVRNTFNPADKDLRPNTSGAETTSSVSNIDFLSNGFKLRNNDADYNGSGTTYIYMAFAENPFVTSGGIPVTAR
jgi:hypothetical protein